MSNSNKNEQSPLVEAVLALNEYFSEIERVGTKISTMDLKSEFDFEQARKLMARFAECGEGVSAEVVKLSGYLNDARVKSDALAQGVWARAEEINSRDTVQQAKMEEFRQLGEKVRALSQDLQTLRRPEGEVLTDQERENIAATLSEFDARLEPLIEQASRLRKEAHLARMRSLEQNADSLTQTLQSIRQKLSAINLTGHAH